MSELLLPPSSWPGMPERLRRYLEVALERLQADERMLGVAAGGSFISGILDEQSDLDLVVAVRPEEHAAVVAEGAEVAAGLGPLLVAFTGEHVGEPRLWICLYGPPLFHIDLKFVTPDQLQDRVEDPVLIWDRDGTTAGGLSRGAAAYPPPDLQWLEDRFWVWVHYTSDKITRGELFEAIELLGFMRARVLGPLAQLAEGVERVAGVRRLETTAPQRLDALRATLARHDAADCRRALRATVELYQELRELTATETLTRRSAAERAAIEHAGIGG